MCCDVLQLATQWLHRQHCVGHLGNVSLVARHRNGIVSCFFFTTFAAIVESVPRVCIAPALVYKYIPFILYHYYMESECT